jgi:hypothetical protein
MKKILILCIALSSIFITSCEGPEGPPGRDGGLIVSQAFEIELDFTPSNNYEYVESYGFPVYPTDVTLVYILWEVSNGQEIWRLLPQNVEFIDGTLTYNYDFTQIDVRFFLDGTINLDTLGSIWTQNQVFRVVVVPADNVGRLNYSDLNVVMDVYNIKSFEKR